MKLKEVLDMTLEKPISAIAKEHLPFGEKILRQLLKDLGCTQNNGKRGWIFTGDQALLEKNISDFAPTKTTKKVKASNSKSKVIHNNSSIDTTKSAIMDDIQKTTGKEVTMKSEIEALIKGSKKETPERIYKGIYFDKDIAEFLDKVQHGNKSELINKVLRAYLSENGLMK